MPLINVDTKPLRSCIQGEYFPEIDDYQKLRFSNVITITERVSRFNWGALTVALLGVVQIAIGVVLEVFTVGIGTAVAAVLIAEGIGDIIYAVHTGLTGTFSWRSYAIHKVISLMISVLTVGLATALRPATEVVDIGARVAIQLFKNSCKRVVKEGIKAASGVAIKFLLDKVLKSLPQEIIAQFRTAVTKAMHRIFQSVVAPLKETMRNIFRCFQNPQEAMNFIQTTFNRVFQETEGENVLRSIRYAIGNIITSMSSTIINRFSNLGAIAIDALSKLCKAAVVIIQDLTEINKMANMVASQYRHITTQLKSRIDKMERAREEISEMEEKFVDEMVEDHSAKMLNNIWETFAEHMAMPHIMGGITAAFDRVCDKVLQIGTTVSRPRNDIDQTDKDTNPFSRISEGPPQEEIKRLLQQQQNNLVKTGAIDVLPADVLFREPCLDQIIRNTGGMTVQQFESSHKRGQYRFYYDENGAVYVEERISYKQKNLNNLRKHTTSKVVDKLPKQVNPDESSSSNRYKDALFYTKLVASGLKIAGLSAEYYFKQSGMEKERGEIIKQLHYMQSGDIIQKSAHDQILVLQKSTLYDDITITSFQLKADQRDANRKLGISLPNILISIAKKHHSFESFGKQCERT
jgi:hypothetical protein